ncbi:uncharacterized protein LOC126851832 [Cataglyphis hispanica]|uniref:uncharacterized protein LOC126851832 n=1 Tax=Cataglyphis hispanica TaxID=1086592 RepID=UPI0021807ADB|nr:uncharacterized protein LOC126851832 [Cataglyphis hispanica]
MTLEKVITLKSRIMETSGIMQTTAVPSHLAVNSLKDIRKIDGHMSLLKVLNSTCLLKKEKVERTHLMRVKTRKAQQINHLFYKICSNCSPNIKDAVSYICNTFIP